MKTEIYQELFHHALFPVFVTDTIGIVSYKNPAAAKYLPMIRKSASVLRHLQGARLPGKSATVKITGKTAYHTALALCDDDGYLFLCLSRFQYKDGEETSSKMIEIFGKTPLDFIGASKRAFIRDTDIEKRAQNRIATDMLQVLCIGNEYAEAQTDSMADIANEVFPKLNRSFSALGYRIHAEIAEPFSPHRYVRINIYDFLFLFGRLLYLQMRLSENKMIDIRLISDDHAYRHHIRFLTQTALSDKILDENDWREFIRAYAPECEQEFLLLKKASLLPDITKLSVNKNGAFVIDLAIDYAEKTSELHVRSTDLPRLRLAPSIEMLLSHIEERLKDIFSSC